MVALALGFVIGSSGPVLADHWELSPTTGARVHWADNGPTYPRGFVYWIDYTGAEWPVYSAAVSWDQAARLDAVYVTSAASCPTHCVDVVEQPIGGTGCSGTIGQTLQSYYPGGHLETSTEVRVDQACSGQSAAFRRSLTCHELGHSFGFDEQYNLSGPSCMVASMQNPPNQYPSSHDYDAISVTYNHND